MSKVAVDFLIQLVKQDPSPPIIQPPGGSPPVCNTTQVATIGVTKTFDAVGTDPDSGDVVTLNVAALPIGATMTPSLPVAGNPVTSTFSWKPDPNQLGQHVLTFTASSTGGGFTLCPVVINVSQPKAIFAGIFGGTPNELSDKPTNIITSYVDLDIIDYVNKNVPLCTTSSCDPTYLPALEEVAHTNLTGGITAVAYHMTTRASRASINTPGNSDLVKTDIEAHYEEGSRVYLMGHSVGGGDVKNLLAKLDALGIPVEVSAHIDSIELGNDATIPGNTRTAMGFFQTSPIRHPIAQASVLRKNIRQALTFCTLGENKLTAVDSQKTTVSNQEIKDPLPEGPADPNTEGCAAYHRNMDNDDRVWKTILTKIQNVEDQAAAARASALMIEENDPHYLIEVLKLPGDARRKRAVRRALAAVKPVNQTFDLVLRQYKFLENDRAQLQSVLAQIDARSIVQKVKLEAAKTFDEALFISLAYSLRKAASTEAKLALLDLAENNSLNNKDRAITAIYMSLTDITTELDKRWLRSLSTGGRLSAKQGYLVERLRKAAR